MGKNKRDMQRVRNRYSQYIDVSNKFGSHINCFRINLNNSFEHELKKFKIFWELRSQGHHIMSEAKLIGGGIADLVDLDVGEVIEILHTETREQAKTKEERYPKVFTFQYILTDYAKHLELKKAHRK